MKASGYTRYSGLPKEVVNFRKNAPPKGAPVPSKKDLIAAARAAVAADLSGDRWETARQRDVLSAGNVLAIVLVGGRILPTAKLWCGWIEEGDEVEGVEGVAIFGDESAASMLWEISAYMDAGFTRAPHSAWASAHAPELLDPAPASYVPHGGLPFFEDICERFNALTRERRTEIAASLKDYLKKKEAA